MSPDQRQNRHQTRALPRQHRKDRPPWLSFLTEPLWIAVDVFEAQIHQLEEELVNLSPSSTGPTSPSSSTGPSSPSSTGPSSDGFPVAGAKEKK